MTDPSRVSTGETAATGPPAGPSAAAPARRPVGARRAAIARWIRRGSVVVAAALASLLVTIVTVDIGRVRVGRYSLRLLAESGASAFLDRPMHIGAIRARLTPGWFVFENVVIEGPTRDDRPFFAAQTIDVTIPWWTLLRSPRELHLEIRLRGWRMVVENHEAGARLPRLTPRRRATEAPRQPLRVRTFAVYAHEGEFVFDDHVANWGVVARNLQFNLVRAGNLDTYVGTARFSDGTTRLQNFVPMRTDFSTRFQLQGSRVNLRHIDLVTDGARSHVAGYVDFGNWPEQEYHVASDVDFARMRQIFFASDSWRLSGEGRFTGIFRLSKTSRELRGQFASDEAGLSLGRGEWRFLNLHGGLEWLPDRFAVTHADADFLGGRLHLTYGLAPFGRPEGATAQLTAQYEGVDLHRFTRQFGWTALEPVGRMRGDVRMAWPNGRFTQGLQASGATEILPPAGVAVASPMLDLQAGPVEPEAPFLKYRPLGPFPLAAKATYRFTGATLDFEDSWVSTPSTYVRFSGHARGGPVRLPFHVTSHDWQQSDRLFAAIMTNFASETGAIPVGGRGTFDGELTKAFDAPRIEGRFDGWHMRAWDVIWGRATGQVAIENGYLDLADGRIRHASGGEVAVRGRFSLGYPRADAGEEIDAEIQVALMPLETFQQAFGLMDWPVTGTVASASMHLEGAYERPGDGGRPGTLRLVDGTAWDEPFEAATGALEFGGDGSLRMRDIAMDKAGGRITGDAWLSWAEGRYWFRAATTGTGIPVERLATFRIERAPLSGQMTFTAEGEGRFESPSWTFTPRIADLYAGDEGIGAVVGRIVLRDNVLQIDAVAASDRLQVSGGGEISLNDARDARLHFRAQKTSIDPYLKFVAQDMPYSRAIAGGSVAIQGPLAEPERLSVSIVIDEAQLTLFDYPLQNDGEIRVGLENNVFRLEEVRLRGRETNLELAGTVDATARTADLRASGQANLAVLQAFYPTLSAGGAASLSATLTGSFDALVLDGRADITGGRLRHFSLPHGLSEISGPIVMREGRIRLEDPAAGGSSRLRAVMGEGPVVFGGSIMLDGYRPSEYDLSAEGRSMQLRVPDGLRSTVDARLFLRGPIDAPVLSGVVDVLRASYALRLQPEAGYFDLLAGVGPGSAGPALAPEAESAIPMALDIRVRSGVLPFIESNQALISGRVDVDITGTIDRPVVTGRVDLDRGEWTFSGYRYRLQGGSIDFSNPLRFEPYFDLSASTRVITTGQTYDVTIRLNGTQSKLDLSLRSEPWLPDFQVISLLLGEMPDVGMAELRARGAPQELQAQALRTAGLAFLTSPIAATVGSVAERVTAIDTVQIVPLLGSQTGAQPLSPTARITLGKRISDRVYLTYSRTLSSAQQNEVILIEIDQNDQVSWILSRNEDRTFALDFRIRYVFR